MMPSDIGHAIDALVSELEPRDAVRALDAASRRARARMPPALPAPTEFLPPARGGGRVPPPPLPPRFRIHPAPPGVLPGRPAPVIQRGHGAGVAPKDRP